MKSEKEQHGEELGPKTPQEYRDYFEVKSERPTFGDRERNSAGTRTPGHDRSWGDAAAKISPQGDGQPGPVTPVSGGSAQEGGDVPRALKRTKPHSTVDPYIDGRSFDPERGRVPDEGKKFEVLHFPGDGKMFANEGYKTPANLRPIKLGWKSRGYDLGDNALAGAPMTVGDGVVQTPQRKRLRKTESK